MIIYKAITFNLINELKSKNVKNFRKIGNYKNMLKNILENKLFVLGPKLELRSKLRSIIRS